MEEKKVLVTGIGGNVAQGILRNIRNSFNNIKIIGCDISSFASGNHLCDQAYKVPFWDSDNYISEIIKIISIESIDMIIPSTEFEGYILSLNKNKLGANLICSQSHIIKTYLDKYETYKYHLKNDIPFATTWLPKEFDYSVSETIAKPREGRGSRGIIINPKNISDLSDNYVIQPLLKGKEITTAAYVSKENTLHGIFTMERWLSNGTTIRSKVVFDYDNELTSIITKMIKLGGLVGSFNIQSIVTLEHKVIPFEINCRISGTNSIRHNFGFKDVKYTIQEHLFNLKPEYPTIRKGISSRILMDIIYLDVDDEKHILNNKSSHFIY